MPSQTVTFQLRLPAGFDAVLDAWGALSGKVLRSLHGDLARIEAEVGDDAKAVRDRRNALKTGTIARFRISARQYNGIEAMLDGVHQSRKACLDRDIERMTEKVARKAAAVAGLEKALAADRKARDSHAARVAVFRAKPRNAGKPDPQPTKSEARALLDDRNTTRFALHQAKRRLGTLEAQLAEAKADRSRAVPPVVFGGRALLAKRATFHRNDLSGIAAWRAAWDAARSAQILLIGGSDEAFGNKSCKLVLDGVDGDGTPRLAMTLRLPDALRSDGGTGRVGKAALNDAGGVDPRVLHIPGIALPEFGRAQLLAAIGRNAGGSTGGKGRLALTFRFVRDPDFHPGRKAALSAWRVCITLQEALPEAPRLEKRARTMRLGVDVNARHLSLALVSPDGNVLETRDLSVPVTGQAFDGRRMTSERRRALLEAAAIAVVDLALAHGARLVLESLDFVQKKREIEMMKARHPGLGSPAYARMLNGFATAALMTAICRRAARMGVAVAFVNPAYTSLIGEVNLSRRSGLSRHRAAAVAIARRDAGFSERVNHVRGLRGRRNALPAPEEARRHVWRQWREVHRERTKSAAAARKSASLESRTPDPRSPGLERTEGQPSVAAGLS